MVHSCSRCQIASIVWARRRSCSSRLRQHSLCLRPLPQGHGAFRPLFAMTRTLGTHADEPTPSRPGVAGRPGSRGAGRAAVASWCDLAACPSSSTNANSANRTRNERRHDGPDCARARPSTFEGGGDRKRDLAKGKKPKALAKPAASEAKSARSSKPKRSPGELAVADAVGIVVVQLRSTKLAQSRLARALPPVVSPL